MELPRAQGLELLPRRFFGCGHAALLDDVRRHGRVQRLGLVPQRVHLQQQQGGGGERQTLVLSLGAFALSRSPVCRPTFSRSFGPSFLSFFALRHMRIALTLRYMSMYALAPYATFPPPLAVPPQACRTPALLMGVTDESLKLYHPAELGLPSLEAPSSLAACAAPGTCERAREGGCL